MKSKQHEFSFRPVTTEDIPQICDFPQTAEELFFMFPRANYPLTVQQLEKSIESRFDAHVVCLNKQVVGFANLYDIVNDYYCFIGNVIVDPSKRGSGIGKYLLDQMLALAILKYSIKELRLVCFNTNNNALLFYSKFGFVPYDIKPRESFDGTKITSITMKYVV